MRKRILATLAATAAATPAAFGAAACGEDEAGSDAAPAADLPQGSEHVELDPSEFTTEIDNPWWPMKPGNRWVYSETDAEGTEQRVVVTVTDQTKRIANGVEARVVHDVVTEAEDEGRVLATDAQAEVPAGHYAETLLTEDTNPLEPKVYEVKFYAEGVGPVLTLDISGGTGREELLRFRD
jgi:hypothetical protein